LFIGEQPIINYGKISLAEPLPGGSFSDFIGRGVTGRFFFRFHWQRHYREVLFQISLAEALQGGSFSDFIGRGITGRFLFRTTAEVDLSLYLSKLAEWSTSYDTSSDAMYM
jgi:hypothetical protein